MGMPVVWADSLVQVVPWVTGTTTLSMPVPALSYEHTAILLVETPMTFGNHFPFFRDSNGMRQTAASGVSGTTNTIVYNALGTLRTAAFLYIGHIKTSTNGINDVEVTGFDISAGGTFELDAVYNFTPPISGVDDSGDTILINLALIDFDLKSYRGYYVGAFADSASGAMYGWPQQSGTDILIEPGLYRNILAPENTAGYHDLTFYPSTRELYLMGGYFTRRNFASAGTFTCLAGSTSIVGGSTPIFERNPPAGLQGAFPIQGTEYYLGTGTETFFTRDFGVGQRITLVPGLGVGAVSTPIGEYIRTITSITDDRHLTIDSPIGPSPTTATDIIPLRVDTGVLPGTWTPRATIVLPASTTSIVIRLTLTEIHLSPTTPLMRYTWNFTPSVRPGASGVGGPTFASASPNGIIDITAPSSATVLNIDSSPNSTTTINSSGTVDIYTNGQQPWDGNQPTFTSSARATPSLISTTPLALLNEITLPIGTTLLNVRVGLEGLSNLGNTQFPVPVPTWRVFVRRSGVQTQLISNTPPNSQTGWATIDLGNITINMVTDTTYTVTVTSNINGNTEQAAHAQASTYNQPYTTLGGTIIQGWPTTVPIQEVNGNYNWETVINTDGGKVGGIISTLVSEDIIPAKTIEVIVRSGPSTPAPTNSISGFQDAFNPAVVRPDITYPPITISLQSFPTSTSGFLLGIGLVSVSITPQGVFIDPLVTISKIVATGDPAFTSTSNRTMQIYMSADGFLYSHGANGAGLFGFIFDYQVTDLNGSPPTSVFYFTTTDQPYRIPGISNIIDFDLSLDAVLALDMYGQVWSWGQNQQGQMGIGVFNNGFPMNPLLASVTPIMVASGCVRVACGRGVALFQTSSGEWRSCGANTINGQILNTGRTLAFTAIPNISRSIHHIVSGNNSTLFVMNDGTVMGCGFGGDGNLGETYRLAHGSTTNNNTPELLPEFVNVADVSPYRVAASGISYGTWVLTLDGQMYLLGASNDTTGYRGDGIARSPGIVRVVTPTPVLLPEGITCVKLPRWGGGNLGNGSASCIASDGQTYVWGSNLRGQLGLNTPLSAFIFNQTIDSAAHPTPIVLAGLSPSEDGLFPGMTSITGDANANWYCNGPQQSLSLGGARNWTSILG